VADIPLTAAPALGDVNLIFASCVLTERTDIALISVATPHGGYEALAAKVRDVWGLSMPGATVSLNAGAMRAIPLAADQMMLAFTPDGGLSETSVQADLTDVAYTTLQTDAWAIIELSGSGATAALERICPLDLDLQTFPNGAAARTVMEHLGALIVRLEADRFLLMSARSSAQSFLHAVETSCRWTAP